MSVPNVSAEKTFAFDIVARNREALAKLSDSIFYFGEVGLQEYETAALMTSLLEAEGFKIERGIAGFPTAFLATFGSGGPVVAVHTEYDANPENSQVSGVTEQREIVPGAPGHCEGHNVNGAVIVTSAIAMKRTMERFGLKGTLKIFGARSRFSARRPRSSS
jgi:aminobenzoyl-glutamate utilization protein B